MKKRSLFKRLLSGFVATAMALSICFSDKVFEDLFASAAEGDPSVTVKVMNDGNLEKYPNAQYHFASTKAPRAYTEARYGADDFLVFGCETKGLPESLLQRVYDRCVRIPMRPDARSLNLANSVAIIVYEALRQQGFPGLSSEGQLTGRQDEAAPWMDYV
jgi:tRNA C32,U32 (ribose-2'-O)-methylase TrmJ